MLSIWGDESGGTYGSLDIMAVPCHMGQYFWASEEYAEAAEHCVWSKDEAMEYINNFQLTLVYNRGSFKQDKYGHQRVLREAAIEKIPMDHKQPNWVDIFIQEFDVSDDTELLQIGLTEEDSFEHFLFKAPKPSVMNNWPTENNTDVGYKYTGMILNLSQDVSII